MKAYNPKKFVAAIPMGPEGLHLPNLGNNYHVRSAFQGVEKVDLGYRIY